MSNRKTLYEAWQPFRDAWDEWNAWLIRKLIPILDWMAKQLRRFD